MAAFQEFKQIAVSCGLDVHKKTITACLISEHSGKINKEHRKHSTMTRDLEQLGKWLVESGCSRVAMESTGQYWKPVFNILEEFGLEVILANARHVKNLPGRKTDMSDAEWLAVLNRNGLIRASFIPPRIIRELRDLCRLRFKTIHDRTRIKNRISKFLEDANIKLSSVASDLFGVSGMDMLKALAAGAQTPQEIAILARGRLKKKHAALLEAAYGRITNHHRIILRSLLGQFEETEKMIAELDRLIADKAVPFCEEIDLLCTIPGIKFTSAVAIIAEVGVNMSVFPTYKHISSWAGVCPGNNESAGKHYSGRMPKGNGYLKAILCQAAWVASRSRDTYLSRKFWALKVRRGEKRATMAIAHKILIAVFHILKNREPYRELGPEYLDKFKSERTISSMVQRLVSKGYTVVAPVLSEQPTELSHSP